MHGHDAGDVVLRQFGQALMDNCRVAVLYTQKRHKLCFS